MTDLSSGQQTLTIQQAIDLAVEHHNAGRLPEAEGLYTQILQAEPEHPVALNLLGVVAHQVGKNDVAVDLIGKALAIKPDYAEAYSNLGLAFQEQGKLDDATTSYRKALAINADYAEVHNNLGNALTNQGKLVDAVASYRKAIAINADFAKPHNNLGNALKRQGKLDDAAASYHKAIAIKPDYAGAHSNLLLNEHYRLGHTANTLYALHCDWDTQFVEDYKPEWPEHQNERTPNRLLRIGFVSADLGHHPVGYFVVGLLTHLSSFGFQTYCYSDRIEDELTTRIRATTDVWQEIRGWPDEQVTSKVMGDQIDILIDLTGHSANNRLLVFARKPAPLQVSWAGYMATTGLSSIDYLISDKYSTLEDEEEYYQEQIIRMPNQWVCYEPPSYAPKVGPLPAKRNGYVTFCSFSNPAKLNAEVISLWTRILKAVDNSQLIIKYNNIDTAYNIKRLTDQFEAEGVSESRLILEGKSPHAELFERYNDVDIALDPFPYSGGVTTYEALWMGVPVITVPGATFASRHSLSHLMTIGYPEFVAKDQDHYFELATQLAHNQERLSSIRSQCRQKMAASPSCDSQKFAKDFGTLMRGIWWKWCTQQL